MVLLGRTVVFSMASHTSSLILSSAISFSVLTDKDGADDAEAQPRYEQIDMPYNLRLLSLRYNLVSNNLVKAQWFEKQQPCITSNSYINVLSAIFQIKAWN